MGNLTTPKRTDASIAKLGGNDPSAHQYQRPGPPAAAHRITQDVSEMEPPERFREAVQDMSRQWVANSPWLAPSDVPALVYLCDLCERREEMRARPKTPQSQYGQIEALIARFMGQMGLTPASRIQLGLAQVEAETKLELFLAANDD